MRWRSVPRSASPLRLATILSYEFLLEYEMRDLVAVVEGKSFGWSGARDPAISHRRAGGVMFTPERMNEVNLFIYEEAIQPVVLALARLGTLQIEDESGAQGGVHQNRWASMAADLCRPRTPSARAAGGARLTLPAAHAAG